MSSGPEFRCFFTLIDNELYATIPMKLTIERAALLRSLNHVQSVVERRNTIPILSNVHIDAKDGTLSLMATDMDIEIVEKVAADVQTDGSTTAPAHMLYDIVRKLPEGAQAEFETNNENAQLILKSGRSRFTLSTLPTAEFPVMTGDDMAHRFSLAGSILRSIIDRTRFAISTEETRYYLNGIFLHGTKSDSRDVMRAVATDGHRLARVEMAMPEGALGMPDVIVPRKTVGELRRLIDETDEDISVELSDTKIRFSFDAAILTSKLIDGTFPEYDRVIPADNDKLMEVDCKPFAEAVDRVSTISTEISRAIKLNLDKGNLTLSASSPDNGTATEEFEVTYDEDPIEIGFNSRYLLDIMQQIDGTKAQFALADAASPTIVRNLDDSDALYVLMPMRV